MRELSKEDLYSMIAKGIVEHAKTSDELTAVKAELAELRHTCISADAQFAETHRQLVQATFERDELRKAALGLGKLCHAGEYLESDREFMCDTDMQRHNALVAKLRAEKGEAKAT